MKDNHFEDNSVYYANKKMVYENLAMSMNTLLVYDISAGNNVKIVKKADDAFFIIAQKDIKSNGLCFYGKAVIYRELPEDGNGVGSLIWEL